ncbi:MAG: CBS domain-containing protein [Woeseiaceae bacterium]|nr:CBS domain-containing protein [Woeseiaceae bacterium]
MKLVQHLLDAKGDDVISIAPDASVFDAIKLMADKGVGSLIVMKGGDIKGIITERDYARKVIIKGRSSESTSVGEIMTADVVTTTTEQTVNQCMALMTENRIRHLPVVVDANVVGMISMRDLVHAIISDQQEEIEQLEHYISG